MKTKEIDEILKKIPGDKQNEATLIAKKLNYMDEKLAEIQKQIDEQGVIEHFINGKQDFLRESPALASYTKLMKIYDTFYKNLINLLPKDDKDNFDGDSFDDFIEE